MHCNVELRSAVADKKLQLSIPHSLQFYCLAMPDYTTICQSNKLHCQVQLARRSHKNQFNHEPVVLWTCQHVGVENTTHITDGPVDLWHCPRRTKYGIVAFYLGTVTLFLNYYSIVLDTILWFSVSFSIKTYRPNKLFKKWNFWGLSKTYLNFSLQLMVEG